MAPRRRTGNSEPPGCAEEIRVADAGQGIVDRQAGMHSGSLVDDLQQVVEAGSGLDQQSLLAPAVRPGRGDKFFRVHRLGGDDRGVGERIGDLVVGLAVVVEVVAVRCAAGLALVFVQIVADHVDLVPDRTGPRALLDLHPEVHLGQFYRGQCPLQVFRIEVENDRGPAGIVVVFQNFRLIRIAAVQERKPGVRRADQIVIDQKEGV